MRPSYQAVCCLGVLAELDKSCLHLAQLPCHVPPQLDKGVQQQLLLATPRSERCSFLPPHSSLSLLSALYKGRQTTLGPTGRESKHFELNKSVILQIFKQKIMILIFQVFLISLYHKKNKYEVLIDAHMQASAKLMQRWQYTIVHIPSLLLSY